MMMFLFIFAIGVTAGHPTDTGKRFFVQLLFCPIYIYTYLLCTTAYGRLQNTNYLVTTNHRGKPCLSHGLTSSKLLRIRLRLSAIKLKSQIFTADSDENEVNTYAFPYFSRSQWNARCPQQVQPLHTPVPYVVIHHSYIPAACYSSEECAKAMRSMQDFHMDGHGWWDIGYRYLWSHSRIRTTKQSQHSDIHGPSDGGN